MNLDLTKYLEMFREESQEYLSRMHALLDQLPGAEQRDSIWNEMFRFAHSIKGMAASLGFSQVETLAHSLEDYFARIRKEPYSAQVEETTREGLALLAELMEQGESAERTKRIQGFQERLVRQEPSQQSEQEVSLVSESPPAKVESVPQEDQTRAEIQGTIHLNDETNLPSARWMVIWNKLRDMGEVLSTEPPMEVIQKGQAGLSFKFRLVPRIPLEHLQANLETIPDVKSVQINEVTPLPSTEVSEAPESLTILPTFIRVPLENVDKFFELASAMFMQVQRIRGAAPNWASNRLTLDDDMLLRDTESLARQMYLQLLDLRMLPLSILIEPLRRMVTTLGLRMNKKVKLVAKGEEIRLDKAILEHLTDCFVHMVRNSVDHGIEERAERLRAGKPETGYISIHVTQKGEWLQIVVLDDGRGMSIEKVAQKALENGLVTPEMLRSMQPEEIIMLVTTPGFSTAEQVTELSGRGVGMDVVRHRVEALGGTLRIETKTGKGTKITLRIPSRLAILDTLIVRFDQYHLALPMERIARMDAYDRTRIHYRENVPFWAHGDTLAPFISLNRILTASSYQRGKNSGSPLAPDRSPGSLGKAAPLSSTDKTPFITMVNSENGIYALGVPQIIAEQRSVVQRLEMPLSRIPLFSGITVSPNLEVIPLLDTEYIGRLMLGLMG